MDLIMTYRGTKTRTARLKDSDYQQVLLIAKANNCNTLRDFLEAIANQDLIVVKNFSKILDK